MTGGRRTRISDKRRHCPGAATIDGYAFAHQTLESIPSGAIVIDRSGRLVLINRGAARILGLRQPGPVIGRPCREVLASYPEIARVLLETFDTQTPPNRAELELRHAGDDGPTIGYTLSSVRASDGQVIGAVMLFRDLTRIERLEEQARLRDRLAVLGQMAAGLAHEMRNPLAAIEIHAGLLRRAVEPSLTTHVESLDHILSEARRLNEAVATVLDFVRPVEVVEQPVHLEPLLEAAALEPSVAMPHIDREYAPAGTIALGDPSQLRVAFGNLVRNAREAAGPSGTVWLRTRALPSIEPATGERLADAVDQAGDATEPLEAPDSRQVVVEVADDGAGISEEHRDRMFQPFFTTKPRGSGLGLAIVQKIVQGHHGRIDLASQPGRGTTFRIFLRAAPPALPR